MSKHSLIPDAARGNNEPWRRPLCHGRLWLPHSLLTTHRPEHHVSYSPDRTAQGHPNLCPGTEKSWMSVRSPGGCHRTKMNLKIKYKENNNSNNRTNSVLQSILLAKTDHPPPPQVINAPNRCFEFGRLLLPCAGWWFYSLINTPASVRSFGFCLAEACHLHCNFPSALPSLGYINYRSANCY